MKIIEFGFKNVCSYGNIIQSFKFSETPELILVEGENGAGKSSIKEALTISIYGKSAVRKMKDIPNRRNKNAFTFNRFITSKGDEVYIERTIEPNDFKLTVNSEPRNLPDKRKIDDLIENELTELPFDVFANTISLSFEDLKSFVKLTPTDKRKIVDKILGTGVLSDMKDIVKSDARTSKQEIELLKSEVDSNQGILDRSNEQLEEYKTKVQEKNDTKLEEFEKSVKNKTTETLYLQKVYLSKKKDLEKIKKGLDKIKETSYKNSNAISEIDKKLKIYAKNKCPHCLSDLTDTAHATVKDKLEEKKKIFESKIPDIDKEIKELTSDINLRIDSQSKLNTEFQEISADIKSINRQVSELKDSTVEEDQTESLNNIIESIKTEIDNTSVELSKKEKLYSVVTEMEQMLSDDGIKKALMDKIIPVLNAKILKISKQLDFKFSFEFDNKFDPIISHLGMEISPESLSSGEKKKMNMIVLLSMLELIKMKHPQINILFLDEVFVNLDKNNIYKVVNILKDFVKRHNMTVFVISHETLPEEFFDKKIFVKDVNGFSEMEVTDVTSKVKTMSAESV